MSSGCVVCVGWCVCVRVNACVPFLGVCAYPTPTPRVAPAGLSFLTLPKDEQHAWGRDGSSYAQLLAEAEGNWEEARVVMPTYWATSDRQSLYTRVPHLASRATWAAAKSEVEGLNKLLGAVLDGAHAVPYIRTSGVCTWVVVFNGQEGRVCCHTY